MQASLYAPGRQPSAISPESLDSLAESGSRKSQGKARKQPQTPVGLVGQRWPICPVNAISREQPQAPGRAHNPKVAG